MKNIQATVFSSGETATFPPSKLMGFRPSVYGIILHGQKLLLLGNKNSNKLSLPGGGIELGETIEEALHREIQEEAGISIQIRQLLGTKGGFFYYDPTDELWQTFLFFYICDPVTTTLLADEKVYDVESEKPRWVDWQTLQADDFQIGGTNILGFLRNRQWG